jgi:hypothetical protein
MAVGTTHVGSDFDPHLSQLPLVFDLDSVAALFERHWMATDRPEAGQITVRVRGLKDIKYQPGIQCVSTYELTVDHGGEGSVNALGVLRVNAEGVQVARPEEDPELDRLRQAMDPEYMRQRLRSASELRTELTGPPRITLLRYKPRLRCALRYDLPTSSGDQVLFGKMLAQGGEQTMFTLSRLHSRSLEHDEMPRFAPPLLYWPEERLLLQEAVDGDEFHSMVFDNQTEPHERAQWMRRAGERLAGLHLGLDPRGPRRSLREDVEELTEYTPAIAASDPQLADLYSTEVRQVAMRADDDSSAVPSHGAFRTDQFLIRGGELVLIDLDGYCWADPARDIGNMFAYLRWRSIRQPHHAPFVESAKSAFLEGYASVTDLPRDRKLALFEAASLLKIAGRRYRGLTWAEWHLVPRVIHDARNLLDE